MRRLHTWTWLLLAAVTVLAGCGAQEPEGYESGDEPQPVLDAREAERSTAGEGSEPSGDTPEDGDSGSEPAESAPVTPGDPAETGTESP